ncbi:hypothetical protein BDV96DRAFT_534884 [Lophiotrema nucula]|uniref:FAD-binding PCMH-type domain-containing protein n=1 Tax=Lophiotrema nucula TaxID=690887 RepID=A0A6A5YEA8_9PLEO|nr:hypothetical protein BDV96DRAFT_534884 [Lophiotrema nucula]
MRLSWLFPGWTLISSASAYQNTTISPNCQNACQLLQVAFGPTAVQYFAQDNFTIWDAKQQEVRYACRFEPSNTTDVAAGLRILTGAWCNFAVKCGGHSRDPDFSSSVGGVTIDLKNMNGVEAANNGTRARIGGGAVTADVYAALDARNLTFAGGRVGSVGVGGFATGGGTSPLASRHGWAIDSIYEYELVLPNATVVTVDEHQHPELYWALRGAGGGNFGIITSFVIQNFPQGQLYAGSRAWNGNYTERVIDEVYNLYTSQDNNSNMSLEYYYGYVARSDNYSLAANVRYYDPVEDPQVFDRLDSIPAIARSQRNITLGNLAGPGHIPATPPPLRHLFQTTTNFPSREWLQNSLRIFREEIGEVKSVEGINPQLITYPIPSRAIRGMTVRGGNALGLNGVQGPLFVTLLSTAWASAEDDARVGEFYDRVFKKLEDSAQSLNVYHPYKYIGYGRLGQDIFSSYGEANNERLVQVQESVDPQGIFTSGGLCHGGFKLR